MERVTTWRVCWEVLVSDRLVGYVHVRYTTCCYISPFTDDTRLTAEYRRSLPDTSDRIPTVSHKRIRNVCSAFYLLPIPPLAYTLSYSICHVSSALGYPSIITMAAQTVNSNASVNGKTSQKAVVCHGAVDLRVVRLLFSVSCDHFFCLFWVWAWVWV